MADKKIEPGCFRQLNLNEGESRIIIFRHGDHFQNVLTPAAIIQGQRTGVLLREAGLVIDQAVSSPSPRALMTNLMIQQGYGKMAYLETDTRLADLAHKRNHLVEPLKTRVAERGLSWGDPAIATVGFDPDEKQFYPDFCEMAEEAGDAIISCISTNQTCLITSHGVGRIEPGINCLIGSIPFAPERLLTTGQGIELIFDAEELLVEINWLEVVA